MIDAEELEQHRAPLTRHCYRMTASAADADDAVQETIIRALRHVSRYDPDRAQLSTWLHGIATHVCLDLLRGRARRARSIDLGPASARGSDIGAPLPVDRFVEPMPDARLLADLTDPADLAAQRDTVRLAFVAALHRLPARQRAVLLLRDVVGLSAAETAEQLDSTVASVTSALQRARDTLAADAPDPASTSPLTDPAQRQVLDAYVAAFEAHDMQALTRVLAAEVRTSMPPFAWWLTGRADVVAAMGATDACVGDRLLVTAVNGGAGLGQYRPDETGRLRPFAIVAVEIDGGAVTETTTFLGTAERFAEFGLPEQPD